MMTWQEEIRMLGEDFMIDRKAVDKIIRDVSKLQLFSQNQYYQRAWKKLFDLM